VEVTICETPVLRRESRTTKKRKDLMSRGRLYKKRDKGNQSRMKTKEEGTLSVTLLFKIIVKN
jgi:hypothetical protein